jgi:hypothetical protein
MDQICNRSGGRDVRAMFWQRKSARLTARLNTLVETSERVRKTRRRAPSRVIIDRSYVEGPVDPYDHEEVLADAGQNAEELQGNENHVHSGEEAEARSSEPPAVSIEQEFDHETEESAILHEAIEQLDNAESRAAEASERENRALEQVKTQQALVENLQADFAREQEARQAAEAEQATLAQQAAQAQDQVRALKTSAENGVPNSSEHDGQPDDDDDHAKRLATLQADADVRIAVARKETDAQRRAVDQLQRDLLAAQTAREAAEAARDAAVARVTGDEAQMSELRESVALVEIAAAKEAGARKEADAREKIRKAETSQLQGRTDELQAALKSEQKARTEAEKASTKAAVDTDEVNQELDRRKSDIARKTTELKKSANRLSEVEADASKTKKDATKLRGQFEGLEKDTKQLRVSLAEAEETNASLKRRETDVEVELAGLRKTASQHELAVQRAETAEKQLKQHREQVAFLEKDARKAQTALSTAVEKADKAAQSDNELAKELAALRKAAARQEQVECDHAKAVAREAAAKKHADGQQDKITQQEQELIQVRTELIDSKARQENAAKSVTEAQNTPDASAEQEKIGQPKTEVVVISAKGNPEDAKANSVEVEAALPESEVSKSSAQSETSEQPEQSSKSAVSSNTAIPEVADKPLDSDDDRSNSHSNVSTKSEPDPAGPLAAEAISKELAARLIEKATAATNETTTAIQSLTATRRPKRIAAKTETAVQQSPVNVDSTAPRKDLIKSRIGKAIATKEKAKDNRNARRMSARKIATLWQDGMSAGLSCTMLDRSSTGAKLEVVTDRYNDRLNNIAVGDRFTVTLSSAQERTSMACEVMWTSGKRCGVRFCGQIHTELVKAPKRAMPKEAPKKSTATTTIKSLFGAGAD